MAVLVVKTPRFQCRGTGNCRSRMERISGPFKKWFWQTVKGTFNGRRPTLYLYSL